MFEKISKVKYLLFVLLILIIIFFIQRLSLSSEDEPANYFPDQLMVNSFKGNLDNDEFTQIVDRIEDDKIQMKQTNNDSNVVMVYEMTEDRVRLVYTMERTEELEDDYITNLTENRDDIIIQSPLEVDTTW